MLYFFHHYELPVLLQQAQLQQLLMRSHHGIGGMVGLSGIAAIASGAAYNDAPGTGTQATPPTTQSTTQTINSTAQSTTQTTPSVSTAQTNTMHTGDVASPSDVLTPEPSQPIESANAASIRQFVAKKIEVGGGDADVQIRAVPRSSVTESSDGASVSRASSSDTTEELNKAKAVEVEGEESEMLDRRRSDTGEDDDPPLVTTNEQDSTVKPPSVPFDVDDLD